MIFYDCSTAPNPRRARMFIAEKGIEIETRDISIAKGEQLSDEFKAVSRFATLPALLTEEGEVLGENLGIAGYLEAKFPEPPLMGTTPLEKGAVLMWNAIAEFQGGMPVAEVLRNTNPHFKDRAIPGPVNHAQIPDLAERGAQRLADYFKLIEERLQNSAYLACDSFTLADITGFVFVDFARVIRARIPEGNSATQAWFDKIKARPSAGL